MSTRKQSVSRKAVRGKKVEEPPAVIIAPPQKTEEELLEEQFAATLRRIHTHIHTQILILAMDITSHLLYCWITFIFVSVDLLSVAAPIPLHSVNDIRWALSHSEIEGFCFPSGEQHPRSRGRLWVLATQGPIIRRHSYTACLCSDCQKIVRERRKEDPFCQRLYAGELFTEQNVPLTKKAAAAAAAAAESAVAAAASSAAAPSAHPAVPALSGVAALQAGMVQLGSTVSAAPVSLGQGLSAVHNTVTPVLRPDLPTALHRANPPSGPSMHSAYGTHTVDQMPWMCRSCAAHARSAAHVLGGASGKHVLTSLEVDELARRLDEEDLLRAYGRLGPGAGPRARLAGAEEREFLAKLDGEKIARAKLNYTPAQLEILLSPLPRLVDTSGTQTDLIDFYVLRASVLGERHRRVDRLGQMYPDAATKGDKGNLQDAAITMVHDFTQAKRRTALPQKIPKQISSNAGDESKQQHPDHVNGVQWPGESLLTYSLLPRKFAPHHTAPLRTRLLHKHTHEVAELGRCVDNPAVQLSVALMRNTHLHDKTEGWKSHF
jgi:hypothetical protein